jgi:hypothetical protein
MGKLQRAVSSRDQTKALLARLLKVEDRKTAGASDGMPAFCQLRAIILSGKLPNSSTSEDPVGRVVPGAGYSQANSQKQPIARVALYATIHAHGTVIRSERALASVGEG